MDASDRKRWLRAAALFGALYLVIAIVFGQFASRAASDSMRETWNRLAFVASGIAFAVHIAYEHFRLRNPARRTAWHTSVAVAFSAFLLALAANIHDLGSATGYRPRMLIALVAWPLITGVPAFIVALVMAALPGLKRQRG